MTALFHRRAAAASALLLALLTGCSTSTGHPAARGTATSPAAEAESPSPRPPLPDAVDPSVGPSPAAVPAAPTAVPRVPVAQGGAPLFTSPGQPPVLYRVPTSRHVVFLTIDDGWTRDPGFLTMVARARVPLSTFLIGKALTEAPSYWSRLSALGAVVEDHTLTHPQLPTLSAAQQQAQVCGDADLTARVLGRRPTLLRPPYGSWNRDTVAAAAHCGLAAVVLWDVSVVHGQLHFAEGSALRPGDVLLLHFTPWIKVDFAAALQAVHRAGYAVGSLEDFVRPGTPRPTLTPAPTRRPSRTPSPAPRPSGTPTRTPAPSRTPSLPPSGPPSTKSPTPGPTST